MVVAPLLPGQKCFTRDKEGLFISAVILDQRVTAFGSLEYYVHYEGKDRRFDKWISNDGLKVVKTISRSVISNELKPKRIRRTIDNLPSSQDVKDLSVILEKEHEDQTRVKYIETVRYGIYELDTWYFSPYPDEFGKQKHLFICEFCMLYVKTENAFIHHKLECCWLSPPGREIYREGNLCFYEVSGDFHKFYCQCLCLFSKLFLNDKTIYYDTSSFFFYVLCEVNDQGHASPVGYFSKEHGSPDGHNLNCLLVFPPFQRKGYGKLLIQLSYEFSKREKIIGTPERPLSDLGYCSYRSYWAYLIVDHLRNMMNASSCTIGSLSRDIGIKEEDIFVALQWLQLVNSYDDPIRVSFKHLNNLWKTVAKPPRLLLNSRFVRWKPNNSVNNNYNTSNNNSNNNSHNISSRNCFNVQNCS